MRTHRRLLATLLFSVVVPACRAGAGYIQYYDTGIVPAADAPAPGVDAAPPDGATEDVAVTTDVLAERTDTCPDGTRSCNGTCVDVTTDPTNCGACGVRCGVGLSCVNRICRLVCPDGQATCSTGCADLQTSLSHCGACEHACASGQTCVSGTCTSSNPCSGGTTWCGGSCVNLQTDAAHCGSCTNVCASGRTCVSGVCTASNPCSGGTTWCGSSCVNLQSDVTHCGTCTTVCASGQSCVSGSCTGGSTCTGGTTLCDATCVNLQTDAAHCGTCTTVCGSGQVCASGSCRVPGYSAGVPMTSSVTFPDACTLAGGTTLTFVTTGSTATSPNARDDGYATITLPFSFPFYGVPRTSARVVTNGLVVFDTAVTVDELLNATSACATATPPIIPGLSPTPINHALYAYWVDLELGTSGTVCTATTGSTGARKFVITWKGLAFYVGHGGSVTFSAVLDEATRAIDLHYRTFSYVTATDGAAPGNVSIGVRAAAAASGASVSCGNARPLSANQVVRLTPVP